MGIYAIRLPDVGEGIAEAELTEWHVKPGDIVKEDDVLAAVMTDKAAVEVPSSVEGKVVELGGEIGDMLAIGSVLVRIEVDGDGNEDGAAAVVAWWAWGRTSPHRAIVRKKNPSCIVYVEKSQFLQSTTIPF